MKNADMPAMPNSLDIQTARSMREFEGDVTVDGLGRWQCGLTKREEFAKAAMQGLTSSAFKYMAEGEGHATDEVMAMMNDIGAVSCHIADALLAELEKEKPEDARPETPKEDKSGCVVCGYCRPFSGRCPNCGSNV